VSVKSKLFSNTISSGLQFGSRWLVNLMLAQSLVPSVFGIFSFVYSVSIILATFFSFGSNLYLLKEIGEIKNYDDKIMTFIKSLIITVILFLSFLIVYLLCFYIFASLYKELIYGILLGFIFSINSNIYYFFKGLGFFDKEAKAYFIFSIILLFVFSVLYYNNSLSMLSVESIFAILIIVNFVPLILGIRYLKNDISFHVFKSIVQKLFHYKNVLFEFKKRFVYGLHELQSILFANLPTIFNLLN
jgi:O-antigen/teichoic acid export membrane protein